MTNASVKPPKIWYSRMYSNEIEAFVGLDFELPDNSIDNRLDFWHRYHGWRDIDMSEFPGSLFFRKGTSKIKVSARDAMLITGGFLIISPAFRDVLMDFDLGATRLIELPIYRSNGKTLADYPPHYLVHMLETKSGLFPEQSEGISLPIPPGKTEPLPHARWGRRTDVIMPDKLAVAASVAEGADLWVDEKLKGRIFFSDRLRRAIKAAKIKSRGLDFVAAKVVA